MYDGGLQALFLELMFIYLSDDMTREGNMTSVIELGTVSCPRYLLPTS